MKWFLLLLFTAALSAAPKIIYTKSFPNSTPAYVYVEISSDGSAVYKESPDDDNPTEFHLLPADTKIIFDLAEHLDHFKRPLESGLKVAFMGSKTFRWMDGNDKFEQKFNYSIDEDAKTLADWFEKITETQMLEFNLERTIRFDKLEVNRALIDIQAAVDRKRLIAPGRFLPMLDRIAKNETFLHMARERAAELADLFRKAQ
jgi:hypothetical protein